MSRSGIVLAAGFFLITGLTGCGGAPEENIYTGAFDMEIVVEPSERAAKEPIPPTASLPSIPREPSEAGGGKIETNKMIQRSLKKIGLYKGPVDGIIGKKTRRAIEKFQGSNGLVVDGKVGPKTWSKLKEYL